MNTNRQVTPKQMKGSDAIKGQFNRIKHLPSNILDPEDLLRISMESPKWNNWDGNWDGNQKPDK